MKLVIIRHGESEADLLHVHEGRADFYLTDRGHRQAEAMAAWVAAHEKLDAIYASPMHRASETAVHLSDVTGVPIVYLDDLREHDNGLLAGLPFDEANAKYPYVPNLPIDRSMYEQEPLLDFRMRGDRVLHDIITRTGNDDTIAIVTHGGMINQLYASMLGLPVRSGRFFSTADTGIHVWYRDEGSFRIRHANLADHIAGID